LCAAIDRIGVLSVYFGLSFLLYCLPSSYLLLLLLLPFEKQKQQQFSL
jgi:hypothetical protein